MNRVAIAFGGNRGDVRRTVRTAIEAIANHAEAEIVAESKFYRTEPVGRADEPFLNGVVIVETALAPERLMGFCQTLEREAGRLPGARWDDRPLDLDLVFCGSVVVESQTLTVPHRLMHVRRFVLDPLVEVWPEAIHPVFGLSVVAMLEHWQRRPLRVEFDFGESAEHPRDWQKAEKTAMGSMLDDDRWRDRVERVDCNADLTLSFASVDPAAWPPGIDLRDWPLSAVAAVEAALGGVLDEPHAVDL